VHSARCIAQQASWCVWWRAWADELSALTQACLSALCCDALLCDQCAFLERDAAGFLAPAGSALQVATALSLGLKEEQHANKEVEQRMQSWCVFRPCIPAIPTRVCIPHACSPHACAASVFARTIRRTGKRLTVSAAWLAGLCVQSGDAEAANSSGAAGSTVGSGMTRVMECTGGGGDSGSSRLRLVLWRSTLCADAARGMPPTCSPYRTLVWSAMEKGSAFRPFDHYQHS
jgi:hypothetical protein